MRADRTAQGVRRAVRLAVVLGAAALVGAGVLGGCARQPIPVRSTGIAPGHGLGPLDAGSAVFASSGAVSGAEHARSDARFAHGADGRSLDGVLNAWPESPRPSLRDARRLSASMSSNQFVYVPRGAVRRSVVIIAPPPPRRHGVVAPPAPIYPRPPVYHRAPDPRGWHY